MKNKTMLPAVVSVLATLPTRNDGTLLIIKHFLNVQTMGILPASYEDEINSFFSQLNESIIIALVVVACIGVILISSFAVLQQRRIQRIVALRRIPRTRLTFTGRFGRLQKPINMESLRTVDLWRSDPSVRIPSAEGWGRPGTEYGRVHFKTSVAKSFTILERAAMHVDPALARGDRSVSEYMAFLADTCGVPEEQSELFINMYQRARFTEHELSEPEYRQFMDNLVAIVETLEPGGE